MSEAVDYLVIGSGLSALAFSALMAKKNKSVKILEAHEFFGGYGHTFTEGDYRFNAQLHYVISCGEGDVVNIFLKRLGLDKEVTFNLLNADGYDRVYCENKVLNIPYGLENLSANMLRLYPESSAEIGKFIKILIAFREAAQSMPSHLRHVPSALKALPSFCRLFPYYSKTLQEVFDLCRLPKTLQTLVSGQLIDYMLPPKDLSFLVWCALFNGYSKGAYYPTKHFEHVVNSMVNSIEKSSGELLANTQVVEFISEGKSVKGVFTQTVNSKTGLPDGRRVAHYGKEIICNMDPKRCAEIVGINKFSSSLRRKLDYDYSYSSFVFYGVVEGLDLSKYGFGDWNIWHCQPDHNEAFDAMYLRNDYSKPYFATNCRSLHTNDQSHCQRPNSQTLQICTVANYDYWKNLKIRDRREYVARKNQVLDQLLATIEEHYVPKLREHLVFKMAGTPTTNERYVWSPTGGSYGVNLTPRNFSLSRKLGTSSSLNNLHFCSAASGVGGFAGTIWTGMKLYEKLSKDY